LDSVVDVAIASCDDDLKFVAPLATVHCVGLGDWTAPENALDARGAARVGAVDSVGILQRISLEV